MSKLILLLVISAFMYNSSLEAKTADKRKPNQVSACYTKEEATLEKITTNMSNNKYLIALFGVLKDHIYSGTNLNDFKLNIHQKAESERNIKERDKITNTWKCDELSTLSWRFVEPKKPKKSEELSVVGSVFCSSSEQNLSIDFSGVASSEYDSTSEKDLCYVDIRKTEIVPSNTN